MQIENFKMQILRIFS